ncbi:ABC transporter ATP-binding protein [Dermatobacter hominis]|uniref:ABC transporter ATP-binding protein n=1 Tax=Dermatobacter hominis TaxID=2884263 RepID=UPI001D108F43|nr:ABC transporter ATP-binding protein [Dermatobacter hominis]UDY33926.1 ABC transporter ATP-binding protein/permease [Dermatobacter hominis]
MARRLPQLSASYRRAEPFLPTRSRGRLVGVGISGFLSGITEAGVLVLIALGANALVQGDRSIELLGVEMSTAWAMALAAALLGAKALSVLVNASISARLGAEVLTIVRTRLTTAYLGSSFARRSGRPRGDLQVMITNHAEAVAEFAVTIAWTITILLNLFTFVFSAIVVNPIAAAGIVVLGGLLLVLLRPLTTTLRRSTRHYIGGLRDLGADVTELEEASRDLETFGVRDRAALGLADRIDASSAAFGRSRALQLATPPLYQSLALAVIVGALGVLASRGDSGQFAAFGAVVLLLLRSLSAGQQLVTATQRLSDRGTYVDQVREELAIDDASRPDHGDRPATGGAAIAVHDLHFAYPSGRAALDGLDLEIRDGESIGVIGPSGAGKSTLIQVLLRLQPPTSGRVLVGGVPIEEFSQDAWAGQVAYVPQEPVVIRASLADNIRFLRDLPDDRVRAAAHLAHLDEVAAELPDGMDSVLEPGGSGLSGGQRQRVAIARALAGSPRLLVLDEPTSSLDAISERAIQSTLEELHGSLTIVVVAHRLSTLSSCDRLLVLRDGRVEAFDTPERLRGTSDFYLTAHDAPATDR